MIIVYTSMLGNEIIFCTPGTEAEMLKLYFVESEGTRNLDTYEREEKEGAFAIHPAMAIDS